MDVTGRERASSSPEIPSSLSDLNVLATDPSIIRKRVSNHGYTLFFSIAVRIWNDLPIHILE